MIEVKMIADSVSEFGVRICTLQLKYPRFIHSEFMTHRVFSRSASSSRAIPINKIISQVWNDPAMPVHWGANVSGMQAKKELKGWRLSLAKNIWVTASKFACIFAYLFSKIGLHKQIGNRILEPWQFINVIVTSTGSLYYSFDLSNWISRSTSQSNFINDDGKLSRLVNRFLKQYKS